jgi:hypothetical protein
VEHGGLNDATKHSVTESTELNPGQFLVSHVHKFHIFVAVFLISMSHAHVSHHIIYLYKVVPIKFVSLEVSSAKTPAAKKSAAKKAVKSPKKNINKQHQNQRRSKDV